MSVTSLSFPYGESIQWFSPEKAQSIPETLLKDWLLTTGSLTLRLKSVCKTFEVKVLGELITLPLSGESIANEAMWVREVLLCLDGEPWIFARTLIPQSLLDFQQQAFTHLGNKPLGELLFNHDEIQPGRIELAQFETCSKLAQLAKDLNQDVTESLWGRRRYFSLYNTDLIVSEIFLPAAVAKINSQSHS
jgi:chorismate--pyruvate lyase